MECVSYLSACRTWRWAFIAMYGVAVAVGAVTAPEAVWGVADLALGAMTIINLAVICSMSGEVVGETMEYIKFIKSKNKAR